MKVPMQRKRFQVVYRFYWAIYILLFTTSLLGCRNINRIEKEKAIPVLIGGKDNLLWMTGGDRSAIYDLKNGLHDYREVWRAMAEGLADGANGVDNQDGQADYSNILISFHPRKWAPNSSEWFHNDPWLAFTIKVNVGDTDSNITKVEFYRNGSLIGQDTSSPYTYSWSDVTEGSYLLTAKVFDNGMSKISAPVTINVK